MKMVLLSDLHLSNHKFISRLDNIENVQYEKLEYFLNYAKKNNAIILQAGDWHDVPRSHVILLREVRLLEKYKVPIYCVFGQHDQYYRSKKYTSLSILAAAGYVVILSEKPMVLDDGHKAVHVYGCGYGEDEIPKVVLKQATNVLVAHRMVIAKRMWPGQEDYELADRFLIKHADFDLVLCGDAHVVRGFVHHRKDTGSIICNTGPMVRKSVDLWDHEPGFFVYDTETKGMEWKFIPHEPPEKCMTRKHIERTEENNDMLRDFIEAANNDIETGSFFEDNLTEFIKVNSIEKEVVDVMSKEMEEKDGKSVG